MKETMEQKLENKQNKKELNEIFPDYKEKPTLKEGERNILCKLLGHKSRWVHHQFFTKTTERGKEWYECHICPRCKDVQGKLVNITK